MPQKKNTEKLQHWKLDKFVEYAGNPRKNDHAVDKIAAAINEFGFRIPIVAKSDGLIVDGHLRLKAAKKLGLDTVPVLLADDMTEQQIKAFRLSVNKMADLAEWDEELLALELSELAEFDFDMDLIGFTTEELQELIGEDQQDGITEEDSVPELPENPVAKKGDVWLLDDHRILCGDSTDAGTVALLMNGEKADMVFTDPPYGVDYEGINNDDRDGLEDLLDSSFCNMIESLKSGAPCYVFHGDRCADIFHKVFRDYFHFSSMIIWVKNSLTLSRTDYQSKHEPCLYGWNKKGSHQFYGDRKQTSIWICDKERVDGHTTPKPVSIIERAALNSSKGGDLILDLFGGSGSTLIACEKTNRRCFMMEIDPHYIDVIIQRWEEYTGKKAILENKQTKQKQRAAG